LYFLKVTLAVKWAYPGKFKKSLSAEKQALFEHVSTIISTRSLNRHICKATVINLVSFIEGSTKILHPAYTVASHVVPNQP
jgi:hypothetical protein